MDGNHSGRMPDIYILNEDGCCVVELSVPVGPTSRRFLEFHSADRDEAEGLAHELRRLSNRPCSGDAIDAILGVDLLDEVGK